MKGLTVGQRYNRCVLALTLFATLPVKAQEVAIGGTVTPGNSNICSQATGQTNFDCLTQTAAGGLAVLTSVSSPTAALDASATGVDAIAIGNTATSAAGDQDIAIGAGAQANGGSSIAATAVGSNAVASQPGATAFGSNSTASNFQAIAIGNSATAAGSDSVAIGSGALAQNTRDIYIGMDAGVGATASGSNADNLGIGSDAAQNVNGYDNVAVGARTGSNVTGAYNTGFGTDSGSAVTGTANAAFGANTGNNSTGNYNLAAGIATGNYLNGSSNVSIGAFTEAGTASAPLNVNNTVAIGNTALASADNAIAIGLNATAAATSAIAIGNGNSVTGLSSGALGDPNTVSGAGSYAVGNNNTITANNAFALGNGITIGAGLDGAVALGNSSTVSAPVPTSRVTIGGTTYTLAGGSPTSVVSVGAPGAERQVTNVAAGQISATSTDAINGSELYATNQAVANLATGGSGPVQYSNAGTPTASNGGTPTQSLTLIGAATGPVILHNVAAGSSAAASTDAVNGGQLNTLASSVATSLGGGSTYNANTGSVTAPSYTIQGATYGNVGSALGAVDNNLTALNADVNGMGTPYFQANSTQAPASATGSNSIAVGPTSSASAAGSIAIGSGASASTAQSVALGSGATTAAAVATSGTTIRGNTYTFAGTQPVGVVSVGAPGAERQVTNVAAGQISATSTDAINGSELYATNIALNSLTSGGAGTVQYSSAAKPTVSNGGVASQNLTLVGATAAPVTLHNVAPGVAPTDAVNVQQLNSETSSAVRAVEQYLNSSYLGLGDQVNAVQRNADAGTSSAMAMAGVPQSYLPGKSMIGAGVAGYGSESSLAVGLSTLSDNGRWVLKLNGSANTRGKYGAAAGAGITW